MITLDSVGPSVLAPKYEHKHKYRYRTCKLFGDSMNKKEPIK